MPIVFVLMVVMFVMFLCFVAVLLGLYRYLRGENQNRYHLESAPINASISDQHQQMVEEIQAVYGQRPAARGSYFEYFTKLRKEFDHVGDRASLQGVTLQACDIKGMDAEWVVADDAVAGRRVLYLHGGGFAVGSYKSHRSLTTDFARRLKAEVLVINYRLMPEHNRIDSVNDSKKAYQWVWQNGAQGASAAQSVVVMGDSAGGCLSLVLAAWARDEQLPLPNAILAMSPATDSTMSGASMRDNLSTDVLLRGVLKPMMKVPRLFLLAYVGFTAKVRPCNPLVSPLHGDLSNLPPTLLQVSDSETLRDDSIRYAAKAQAQGSPVQLQLWQGLMHVWQIRTDEVPESADALTRAEHFIKQYY